MLDNLAEIQDLKHVGSRVRGQQLLGIMNGCAVHTPSGRRYMIMFSSELTEYLQARSREMEHWYKFIQRSQ